jgi:hypothetical protein
MQDWYRTTKKTTSIYLKFIKDVMDFDMAKTPVEFIEKALTSMQSNKYYIRDLRKRWKKELEYVFDTITYVHSQVHPFCRKKKYVSPQEYDRLEWIRGELQDTVHYMHWKVKVLAEAMKQHAVGPKLLGYHVELVNMLNLDSTT